MQNFQHNKLPRSTLFDRLWGSRKFNSAKFMPFFSDHQNGLKSVSVVPHEMFEPHDKAVWDITPGVTPIVMDVLKCPANLPVVMNDRNHRNPVAIAVPANISAPAWIASNADGWNFVPPN
jgi:hypothetical protein